MTFVEFTTSNDKKIFINKECISELIDANGEVYNTIIKTNGGSSFLIREELSDVIRKIHLAV